MKKEKTTIREFWNIDFYIKLIFQVATICISLILIKFNQYFIAIFITILYTILHILYDDYKKYMQNTKSEKKNDNRNN